MEIKEEIETLKDERQKLISRIKDEIHVDDKDNTKDIVSIAEDKIIAHEKAEKRREKEEKKKGTHRTDISLVEKLNSLNRLRNATQTALEIERDADTLSATEYLDKCRDLDGDTLRALPPACLRAVIRTGERLSQDIAKRDLRGFLEASDWPGAYLRDSDNEHTMDTQDEIDSNTFVHGLQLWVELELTMSDFRNNNDNNTNNNDNNETLKTILCKAVDDIIVSPLVRRFRYHFIDNSQKTHSGKAASNTDILASARPENLQWALRYISDAINSTAPFVARNIQPGFTALDPTFSVQWHAAETLMREAARKITADLERIRRAGEQAVDGQLLGAVTEIIWFQRDLTSALAAPPSLLDMVFSTAEGEAMMTRWIRAEFNTGRHILDEVYKSGERAWAPEPVTGVPRTAACAAELFASYTERYALLSSSEARKNFVLIAQKPVMNFLLVDVMAAAKGAAALQNRELGLIRLCRLATACIHCESALWEWINNELPHLFPVTDSTSAVAADGNQCKKSMTDLVKTLAEQRKELIGHAVDIITQGIVQALRPRFEAQSWGTPKSEMQSEEEYEALERQEIDVSETAAAGMEELYLGTRIALKTLLEHAESGRFLGCKFVKKCFERVNETVVKGLAARQRTITKRALRQFSYDIKTLVDILSEFDYENSDLKASEYLRPSLAACDFLGGNVESAVIVDAQLMTRIKKTIVVD